jgi:lipoprotein NlpD
VRAPHSRGFGDGNKGVDFRLSGVAAIVAAAQGEVVYAGAGLGGYTHLVILKHNASFLSAYGFDAKLVTTEGKIVKAGGKLADISTEGAVRSLHFEVRLDGEPVNPATVIAR